MNRKIKIVFISMIGTAIFLCAAERLTFDRYHNHEEITRFLKTMETQYPKLAKLFSMGRSHLGKEIWVMEITGKGKKAEQKPAVYFDGGTHGNEVTGSEVCLHTIQTVLENYGREEKITQLLDSRTLYIAPSVNPDANDLFVTSPLRNLRNNLRPFDDDNDGKIDEDMEEDINGDGWITQMRKKNHEDANLLVLKDDPRLMIRADPKKGEKGEYKIWSEGIDNDGDGKINEDGPGGINVNRNYPAYWETEARQARAGLYPLSENESRAIVEFFLKHPRISIAQSYHTSGGFLYQPLAGEKVTAIPEADREGFQKLAEVYKKITGNEVRRPFREKGPTTGPYGFGIFIDWAFMHFGIFSGTTELWTLPETYRPPQPKKNEITTEDPAAKEKAWMAFNEKELDGKAFIPWKAFQHPTLGDIEIGGWIKLFRSNPPPSFLKGEVELNTRAAIAWAEMTPLVTIEEVKLDVLQSGQNSEGLAFAIVEVTAHTFNSGDLPSLPEISKNTSLPAQPVPGDLLIIEPLEGARLLAPQNRIRVTSLGPRLSGNCRGKTSWLIQVQGAEARVKIISDSPKGGYNERVVTIRSE